MKNIVFSLIAFLSLNVCAQYTYTEFSMSEFKGLMISYDYKWSYAGSTKTREKFFYPYHEVFIGAMGPIDITTGTSNGYTYGETTTSGSFGAIGLIFGTGAKDYECILNPYTNYYTINGERIVSYESLPLGTFGGRVRLIGLLGESKSSLLSNYFFMDIEFIRYRFNATV